MATRTAPTSESPDDFRKDILDGFAIQAALMKGIEPVTIGKLSLAGRCLPARGVSGDTFDFGILPDGRVWVMLADVSGKGIPAALLMAAFHALFLKSLPLADNPAYLGRSLHDQLAKVTTKVRKYVTAFIGIYDPGSGRIDFLRAGHEWPIRVRRGALPPFPTVGSNALGMFPEPLEAHASFIHLAPGECLVIFSDGVTEAENLKKRMYGRPRLRRFLKGVANPTAESVRDGIFRDVDAWNDDRFQEDDITVLVLQRIA